MTLVDCKHYQELCDEDINMDGSGPGIDCPESKAWWCCVDATWILVSCSSAKIARRASPDPKGQGVYVSQLQWCTSQFANVTKSKRATAVDAGRPRAEGVYEGRALQTTDLECQSYRSRRQRTR